MSTFWLAQFKKNNEFVKSWNSQDTVSVYQPMGIFENNMSVLVERSWLLSGCLIHTDRYIGFMVPLICLEYNLHQINCTLYIHTLNPRCLNFQILIWVWVSCIKEIIYLCIYLSLSYLCRKEYSKPYKIK